MVMSLRIGLLAAVMLGFAGCSSGSGSGDDTENVGGICSGAGCADTSADAADTGTITTTSEPAPTSRDVAAFTGGSLVNASFDDTTGLFTITALGSELNLARFAIADHRSMLAMRDALGIHNAYFGEGTGTQVVVYSGGLAGSVSQVAGFSRTAATSLPLIGSARFDGDYAGFTTTRRINGTARTALTHQDLTKFFAQVQMVM